MMLKLVESDWDGVGVFDTCKLSHPLRLDGWKEKSFNGRTSMGASVEIIGRPEYCSKHVK